MMSKDWSNMTKIQTCTLNILQHNSMMQILPQPTNMKEQPAASSGKETQSVRSKHLQPKTMPCMLKKELQFLNHQDPTHTFFFNSNNVICSACRHRPHFNRCVKQSTPSADESINDKRVSPTHEVATCFARCNVCLADVQLESLWGQTKKKLFSTKFSKN